MIDFNQNTFFKLKTADAEKGKKVVEELLIPEEQVLSAYRDVRDWVIFTDRRIVSVNVESMTGKKKNFRSPPFRWRRQVCWMWTAAWNCGSAAWDACALSSPAAATPWRSAA